MVLGGPAFFKFCVYLFGKRIENKYIKTYNVCD